MLGSSEISLTRLLSEHLFQLVEGTEQLGELFLLRRATTAPMGGQRAPCYFLVVKDRIDDGFELFDSFFFLLRRLQPRVFQYPITRSAAVLRSSNSTPASAGIGMDKTISASKTANFCWPPIFVALTSVQRKLFQPPSKRTSQTMAASTSATKTAAEAMSLA